MCGIIVWEPTTEDMENGHEEIRKPKDLLDSFDPRFELETDAHHEWVRTAKAEFE